MMNAKQIGTLALFLAVTWAAVFMYSSAQEESHADEPGETREIAALVNGRPIYTNQVQKEIMTLTPQQREEVGILDALDFLIEKELLLQEAEKAGIKVSQQEVDRLYATYADPNVFRLEQTEALIEAQNLTRAEFSERLAEQAVINKLLASKTPQNLVIRKEEAIDFYERNYAGANVSFEEAELEIISVLQELKRENAKNAYINSLKRNADLAVFIEPEI